MKKRIVTVVIIIFWIAITAWFIRYEAYPDAFTDMARGYQTLFGDGIMVRDTWMRILFKGQPVGFTHTEIDMDEHSVSHRYLMRNELVMNLTIMGSQEKISAVTDASLDAMYQLQTFELSLHSKTASTRVKGKRVRGDTFYISVFSGGSRSSFSVDIPKDTVVYSPATDVMLAQLNPGEEMTIKTLEPISMTPANVTIRAAGNEDIEFRGETITARAFDTMYMGMSTRSWIDQDGRVLRQETPIPNFVAEACEADEAINYNVAGELTEDILKALSIDPGITLANPRTCTLLELKLTIPDMELPAIESQRQQLLSKSNSVLRLRTSTVEMPATGTTIGEYPEEYEQFLESTAFIQSDHEDIVKQARKIVGSETDSAKAATAIYEWVNSKLLKISAPGIPSALEVLQSRKGDCNEHSYIFAALARAAGLPAKVKVGVLYHETGFYYHAWSAVYVGEWIEMDAAIGQPAVDATHLGMFEGELSDQLGLIRAIGRLEIEILDSKH